MKSKAFSLMSVVGISLFILGTAIFVNAQSDDRNYVREIDSTVYRTHMRQEFNKVIGLKGDSKTARTWNLATLEGWLKNNQARYVTSPTGKLVQDGRGDSIFNFKDMIGFWNNYGNAIGKYMEMKMDGAAPSRLFAFNDGSDEVIVVEPHQFNPPYARTEGGIKDLAEDIYKLMDADGKGGLSQDEFVNYMTNKR